MADVARRANGAWWWPLRPILFDTYLLRAFAGPFLLLEGATLFLLVSGALFDLADLLLVKRTPAATVGRLLLYESPLAVVQALPLATLFAGLFLVWRWQKDGELVMMRVAGLSLQRLFLPLACAGLAISAASFLLSDRVVPEANHRAQNILRQLYFSDAMPDLQQDVFFRTPDNTFVYIRQLDRARNSLQDVMLYQIGQGSGPYPVMITARRGTFAGQRWSLEDGVRRTLDARGFVQQEVAFSHMTLRVSGGIQELLGSQKTTAEMSMAELARNIRLFSKAGIDVAALSVDYYLKVSQPLASFLFLLAAIPVALFRARAPSPWLLGAGVALALSYYVNAPFSRSLAVKGILSPFAGAWLPSLIYAVLGGLVLWRLERT